jgi:CDP-4-dehydro-6-deoxyglucose reductase
MSDPWTPSSEQAPYRVVAVDPRTPTIVELRLLPIGRPLPYRPGQYVLLEDEEGAIAPRSYSIANPPRPDGEISLLVTRVPGGQAGAWIHDRLAPGEGVRVTGPYGTFVDDPDRTAPAVFLAAGSGLAPIRALLESALVRGTRTALTLVFSARGEGHVVDRELFARWQGRDSRFRFIRTLTRETGRPPRGRIPETLASLVGGLEGHDAFVAGPPGFVTSCAAAAEALGTEPAHLHMEAF